MPNQHTKTTIDPKIKEWATSTQKRYIDAVNEHGGMRAAARDLDVPMSAISQAISRARERAAAQNYAPEVNDAMVRGLPTPLITRGNSVLRDGDGNIKLVWEKSQLDKQQWLENQMAVVNALSEELPRLEPVRLLQKGHADNLATVYTLTDSHVGMLAWGRETGADWDLKIAERTLTGCFEEMIKAAPNSKLGFLNQLGDFLHQDGLVAITPTSGHQLDSDGRFEKIIEVAIRVLRRVIGLMLKKHEKVVVLLAEGNHDLVSSIWLRKLFGALYENDRRVEVIQSPLPYYVYRHGEVMLAFHHGHLSKNSQLPLLFAAKFPREWGASTKRYAHTGHRHHIDEREHNGMVVVQHPTLASADAYAARGGWIAERRVFAITYDQTHGEVSRVTVTPEMVGAE